VGSLAELVAAARALALRAGAEILRHYERPAAVVIKPDGTPVTEADTAAERVIVPGLLSLTPEVPVVSEETAARSGVPLVPGRRFWLVDPLDGTKEYIAHNGEFTVNIALIEDGRPVLGVVHAPALGATYDAHGPGTARRATGGGGAEPIRARLAPRDGLTVLLSRSHANRAAEDDYLRPLSVARTVRIGSSVKFGLLAAGEADLYLRFGPTREWDTAAGHAVLAGAGGRVETFDGRELGYGKPDLANPPFIALGAR